MTAHDERDRRLSGQEAFGDGWTAWLRPSDVGSLVEHQYPRSFSERDIEEGKLVACIASPRAIRPTRDVAYPSKPYPSLFHDIAIEHTDVTAGLPRPSTAIRTRSSCGSSIPVRLEVKVTASSPNPVGVRYSSAAIS